MKPIITLTTDFGTSDPYVASMKGVILSVAPDVTLVDVSHEIEPQDLEHGARTVLEVARTFPAGSIHVVVVDPGVGSARRILCLEREGEVFLAPDNGVLSLVLPTDERAEPFTLYAVERPDLCRLPVSATFHGRDIFAPIAARIALGLDLATLGPMVDDPCRLSIRVPEVSSNGREIRGRIAHVDRFGNLISDVGAELLPADRSKVRVCIAGSELGGLVRSYSEIDGEGPGVLIESTGHVEVAIRNGNAAAGLGVGKGEAILLSW